MLPFPIINQYGNLIQDRTLVRFNYDTKTSTGETLVSCIPNTTNISIPVSNANYNAMTRVTNTYSKLNPSPSYNISSSDNFEVRLVFYLYAGGSSYDVIMHYGNTDGTPISSGLWIQIGDSGYQNRLQFGIGAASNDNLFSCNVSRSALESKVNDFIFRRVNGVVTCTLNGSSLLIGVNTNASTNLSLPSTQSVVNNYIYFGEYTSGTQWGVDMGLIDFRFTKLI